MSQIAIAMYRPHAGKESELVSLIEQHLPTLREHELVTDRPSVLARAEDGTFIEIFEWASEEAVARAHTHHAVSPIWEKMGEVADFMTLADLPEAKRFFPNFKPADAGRG